MHVELVIVTLVPEQVTGAGEELSAPITGDDAHGVILPLMWWFAPGPVEDLLSTAAERWPASGGLGRIVRACHRIPVLAFAVRSPSCLTAGGRPSTPPASPRRRPPFPSLRRCRPVERASL
jgi:hypothetical protein